METNPNISCQDSKILRYASFYQVSQFPHILRYFSLFMFLCWNNAECLKTSQIQISFYTAKPPQASNTFSTSLLFILSTFYRHLFYSKAFYYEFWKCSSSLLNSSATSPIHTVSACAFLPLRQIHFSKNLKCYHVFFSPVPQTVIICHWVFQGISHERQRLFKVLHYLSNLKYRICVLRQDFPVLFNRDSGTETPAHTLRILGWNQRQGVTKGK